MTGYVTSILIFLKLVFTCVIITFNENNMQIVINTHWAILFAGVIIFGDPFKVRFRLPAAPLIFSARLF